MLKGGGDAMVVSRPAWSSRRHSSGGGTSGDEGGAAAGFQTSLVGVGNIIWQGDVNE